MTIFQEKINRFNIFLITLISIFLIYRKVGSILIILLFLFFLININFYKKQNLKPYLKYIFIINIPILLEIVFFFNNDSFKGGIKSLEKSLSCLILPYIIIALYKSINYHKKLKIYSIITIVILFISFLLFRILESEYFMKFQKGIDLWQMGYVFSKFIGMHAPALNMYLSFISIFLLNETITGIIIKNKRKTFFYFSFFILSFFFLLLINTRIAIIILAINIIILFFKLKINIKTKLIISICISLIISIVFIVFSNKFPIAIDKFTHKTFNNLDKIGKLDEVKSPEIFVYSSLVTRLSIWKSSLELANNNYLIGVGSSDANDELIKYYKKTNQIFLSKTKFTTHNQFLNYYLKFGILGIICCIIYLFYPLYLSIKTNNIIIFFFFLNFLISNITDDYLNKFDGLSYSSLWYSIFTCYLLNYNIKRNEKN